MSDNVNDFVFELGKDANDKLLSVIDAIDTKTAGMFAIGTLIIGVTTPLNSLSGQGWFLFLLVAAIVCFLEVAPEN